MLEGKTVSYKNELLFQNGINFHKLPSWQKRGMGVYWDWFEKKGFNPVLGKEETALRRSLKVDFELPLHEEYDSFVEALLKSER